MRKVKGFFSASDWCDAILALGDNQVKWLAQQDEARAVINDVFWSRGLALEGDDVATTPLRFAISNRCPLERIQFLVEHAGATTSHLDLLSAHRTSRLDILRYFHAIGTRHEDFYNFTHHVGYLLREGDGEEEAVFFILCYPVFLKEFEKREYYQVSYESTFYRAIDRLENARRACYSLILLKQEGIFNKDIMRMVAQRVVSPECASKKEWGISQYPMVRIRTRMDIFRVGIMILGLILMCVALFLFLLGFFYANEPIEGIYVGKNCATMTCPFIGNPGPVGPPGPKGCSKDL